MAGKRAAKVEALGVTPQQAQELLRLLLEERAAREQLERRLKELEAAKLSRAECTRRARIARTANRVGMTTEQWEAHCKRIGHDDPTKLTAEMLSKYRRRRAAGQAV